MTAVNKTRHPKPPTGTAVGVKVDPLLDVALCLFCPMPYPSQSEKRSRRDGEVLDAQGVVGVGGGQPEGQSRGTRDHPRPRQAAERRPLAVPCGHLARHLARHSRRFTSCCDLCHGKVSPQLLNGNDGTDRVINFDEPVKDAE